MKAASNGHLEAVKFLADKGADIYKSVTHVAAFKGHMELMQYLMKKGASVHTPDKVCFRFKYAWCKPLSSQDGHHCIMPPMGVIMIW